MPVSRPEYVKRCKTRDSCKVNDGKVEVKVERSPRQPGLRSGGPLQLRNNRGKNFKLVDGLPMVIACKDGPVIVENSGKRTRVRDTQTQ
jgi:hypothetical protein